jgi:copper chaperone CopZ
MTTYTYYIHQMHCSACKILVAGVLDDLRLKNSSINISTKQITFQTDRLPAEFLPSLSAKLAEYSYSLSDSNSIKSESLTTPFLTALFFVITFLLLDKLGLSKLLNPSQITLPVVFVIGILASLSTCMALVGGLLLGLSQTKGSHLLFHLSRLVSFFILGGAIGFLGQVVGNRNPVVA